MVSIDEFVRRLATVAREPARGSGWSSLVDALSEAVGDRGRVERRPQSIVVSFDDPEGTIVEISVVPADAAVPGGIDADASRQSDAGERRGTFSTAEVVRLVNSGQLTEELNEAVDRDPDLVVS